VWWVVRILIAGGRAGAAAWGWRAVLDALWQTGDGKLQAVVLVGSTCLVDGVVLLTVARALRITELGDVVDLVRRRLGR
jgi:hypothetical protein